MQALPLPTRSVWAACRSADWDKLSRLLDAKPSSINERGAVGETLLHMCYLLHSDAHTAIAHRLLDRAPALIETIYEGGVYHGENALHMAVANSDMAEARFLFRRCPRLIYGLAGEPKRAVPMHAHMAIDTPILTPLCRWHFFCEGEHRILRRAALEFR